jgi:hypothetical protein
MIQRIQTLWFLLIAIFSGLLFWDPYVNFQPVSVWLYSFFSAIGLTVFLSILAVFLYKNRPLQIKIAYGIFILLVLSCFILVAVFEQSFGGCLAMDKSMLIPPATYFLIAIIFDILAIRAVKKDEKLVRSLDRLR